MTIYSVEPLASTRPTTMKAVRIHEYGGPEVLRYEDAPIPQPGEGEVLVRVQAAGVNPLDYKLRGGAMRQIFPLALPAILGSDFAGVVVEVGAGVNHITVGEHVYGTAGTEKGGAYAQYVVAKAGEIAHKPGALTAAEAASVPVVAQTAWQALHQVGRIGRGDKVLIHGAAGGVGMYAIQFAKQVGCHIIALSTHEHSQHLRDLGADTVLDYNNIQFEQHVSGVDVALDLIGGDIRERTWRDAQPRRNSHQHQRSALAGQGKRVQRPRPGVPDAVERDAAGRHRQTIEYGRTANLRRPHPAP